MRQEIGPTRYSAESQPILGRPMTPRGGGPRRSTSPSHCLATVSSGELLFESRQNQLPMRARRVSEPQSREGSIHHYQQGCHVLLAEQLPRNLGLGRERRAELGRSGPFVTALREPSRLEQL